MTRDALADSGRTMHKFSFAHITVALIGYTGISIRRINNADLHKCKQRNQTKSC
jgi:hypothetical protein